MSLLLDELSDFTTLIKDSIPLSNLIWLILRISENHNPKENVVWHF